MNKLGLIFLIILFINCNKTNENMIIIDREKIPQLKNTRWELKITDSCINYYLFNSDSSFVFYSCETEEKIYGKYNINLDTLYTHEYTTNTDSLLSIDDENRFQQSKYKIIINSGKLKHIERSTYSDYKNEWIKDDFTFDQNHLYQRQ